MTKWGLRLKRTWCYVAHWRHQFRTNGFGWRGWKCGRCGCVWITDWEAWAKDMLRRS